MFERKYSYFVDRLHVLQSTLRITDLQKVITCAVLSKLRLLGWSLVAGGLTLSRNNSSKLLLLCGVITAVEFNNSDGCIPEIPSTGESSRFGFHIKLGQSHLHLMIPLQHCFYMLVLWQQGKYVWFLWGIELGPLQSELASTATMLQAIGESSRHITLTFS